MCQLFMDENGAWSWTKQNSTIQHKNKVEQTKWSYTCVIFMYSFPGVYMQMTSCYLQLMIIVGLCLDSGKSSTSRFFKTKIMQFLGRISMSLYLIHDPLIYWLKMIIFGPVKWEHGWNSTYKIPIWAIPIHVLISLIFAILLTLFLEEPARKYIFT